MKICRYPFLYNVVDNQIIDKEYNVYVCCWARKPIGNIQKNTLDEIWNSNEAQEIRSSMYDGSYRYCDKAACPFLGGERSEGIIIDLDKETKIGEFKDSVRSFGEGTIFTQDNESIISSQELDLFKNKNTIVPWRPQFSYLSFDKSCNLKCPTCRTSFISEAADYETHKKVMEKIKPLPQYISLNGAGEIFASKFFKEWLINATEFDLIGTEKIVFISNGLLINETNWAAVSKSIKEKELHLEISIDAGTKDTYENSNRLGGKWSTLIQNLQFISSCKDFAKVSYRYVVQLNNYKEIDKFIELAEQNKADAIFASLVNWGTFDSSEFFHRNITNKLHPFYADFVNLTQSLFSKKNVLRKPFISERSSIQLKTSGYGFSFFSNFLFLRNSIVNNKDIFFYHWSTFSDDIVLEKDNLLKVKKYTSKDKYIGGGFCHKSKLNITEFNFLTLQLKSSCENLKRLKIGMKSFNDPIKFIQLVDYGFQPNNEWQIFKIPIADFSTDLNNVEYPFAFEADNLESGDWFSMANLFLEK